MKNGKKNIFYGANNKIKTGNNGITLIALVITIIVLLILARSNDCDVNRTEWNINQCTKC